VKRATLDELPDIMTIREVADFMRISPAVAYDMARQYRATGGEEGLPVFMAGARMMRVSKIELAKFVAGETGRGNPSAA
jgi:transposase